MKDVNFRRKRGLNIILETQELNQMINLIGIKALMIWIGVYLMQYMVEDGLVDID